MNHEPGSSSTDTPPAPRASAANRVLAVLAVVLAVGIGVVAMRGPSPARADVVSQAGDTTALTLTAGSQDMLLVLDGRREELMVYRVENQNTVELYGRYSVPRMFNDARGRSTGGGVGGAGSGGGRPGGGTR